MDNYSLLNSIILLMQYGHDPESQHYKRVDAASETLKELDDFITYNLKNLDSGQSCVFYIQESSPWIKEIVAEYLVIRFGTLSRAFRSEACKNAQRPDELTIPERGQRGYNQFIERCEVYLNGKKQTQEFGKIRRNLGLLSLRIDDENQFRDTNERNILVCSTPDLKTVNNSFFRVDFDTRRAFKSQFVALTDTDAKKLVGPIRRLIQKEAEAAYKTGHEYKPHDYYGNIFLLYSGNPRSKRIGSFNMTAQKGLEQFSIHTKQFVIAFPNCDYRLDRMLKAKDYFRGAFNPQNEFYLNHEEERGINPSPKKIQYERVVCPFGKERDIINEEIHSIVDGLDYIRSIMNTLSLCCTERCKDLFFDFIRANAPDYEEPDIQLLFESICSQWKEWIVPKINDFAPGDETIAMLVEPWAPDSIKNEINDLLGNRVSFITPSAFKKRNEKENSIDQSKIVVLRYVPCTDHPSAYPNSYDPYVLREDQSLIEIISDLLFHGHILRSEHNLNRHYRNTLGSKYRRDRGWKQQIVDSPENDILFFTMNYDEVHYGEDTSNRQVTVTYSRNRQSHPVETEPVVYKLVSNEMGVARLKDLIDRNDIYGIQFLSEIEPKLEPLVNKLITQDEEQERIIRQKWSTERGIDLTGPGELWRILLNHKIKSKGLDAVYEDLAPAISDSNKRQVIKDWSDLNKNMTLPGRRSSRKAVLEYLGIPIGSPYTRIIERKARRKRRASKHNNLLIDSLLMEVVGRELSPKVYEKVQRDLHDSLDFFGITNYDDFCALFELIHNQVHITHIESITSENE